MFKGFDLMVNITFYGGVNEVGGNKVLIEDEDVKVLFDFGMSFALRGKFYSAPFLSPKSGLDLIELGILPDLSGLYDSSGNIILPTSHSEINFFVNISNF